MSREHDKIIKGYTWIVVNPEVFGGKPIVKGTRFSIAFILQCLAEGMDAVEIEKTYGAFPKESITEVLKFAADLANKDLDDPNVAA